MYAERADFADATGADTLFLYLPISLYHGFIVVVFFVGAFAAFGVDSHAHSAGIFTKALVFAALFFLESTAAGYVFYGNGDVAGAAVISLGLLAIFQNQKSSAFIHWSALYVRRCIRPDSQRVFRDLAHRRAARNDRHIPGAARRAREHRD